MIGVAVKWTEELARTLSIGGSNQLLMDEASVEKHSKDYYWYSPVLDRQLQGKKADAVVVPKSEDDVAEVLAFAYRLKLPVTARGAGTGNYGQSVPLFGGIVLDLSGLDRIKEIGDGYVRAQSGVRLGVLDKVVREQGQDLRIYPSTYVKATIGGFVSGGSGGIGSVTWGNLWDGNVLEAVIYTMEESPRRITVKGEALFDYIHNYGTTGIMTEVTIALAPRTEWTQAVYQFDHYEDALRYGEALAEKDEIQKRLVSPMEWPLPSYFKPIAKHMEVGKAAVLSEIADHSLAAAHELLQLYGGTVRYIIESSKYRKGVGVSDFSWNHTTLWAMKQDPAYTYLQAGFTPGKYLEQLRELKQKYGEEIRMHFEWIRSGGELVPNALPVVKFRSEEQLYELIRYCESIGVKIFDPHTWVIADGGRGSVARMKRRKIENDPKGLLNPGKL